MTYTDALELSEQDAIDEEAATFEEGGIYIPEVDSDEDEWDGPYPEDFEDRGDSAEHAYERSFYGA